MGQPAHGRWCEGGSWVEGVRVMGVMVVCGREGRARGVGGGSGGGSLYSSNTVVSSQPIQFSADSVLSQWAEN